MKIAGPEQLWHRLENEPERAYKAFQTFLALPSGERTILEAYRSYVANPHAAKPSDTWSQWVSRFAWYERAAAYDDHLCSVRFTAYERGVQEEAERLGVLAERMRAEAFEMLHCSYVKVMEWFEREDFDPREMTMSQVVQVVKMYLEAVKTLGVAERPVAEEGWSEEDDIEFDQILAQIAAEEQRNPETHSDEDKHPEESEDGQPRQG